MKANEMPERISIFDYNDAMVTPIEGDTVYVREDSFIEKAIGWIDYNNRNGGSNFDGWENFQKVYERRVRYE